MKRKHYPVDRPNPAYIRKIASRAATQVVQAVSKFLKIDGGTVTVDNERIS